MKNFAGFRGSFSFYFGFVDVDETETKTEKIANDKIK